VTLKKTTTPFLPVLNQRKPFCSNVASKGADAEELKVLVDLTIVPLGIGPSLSKHVAEVKV